MIDRHPDVIVRCSASPTSSKPCGFARHAPAARQRPRRGAPGGRQRRLRRRHGDGPVGDDGVLVDPNAHTARAQAGARWADVDRATQLFGLATTGGEVSMTGVAGLTLGGGMGVLTGPTA